MPPPSRVCRLAAACARRPLVATLALFLAPGAAIATGALDRLVPGGSFSPQSAYASLFLYWLLTYAGLRLSLLLWRHPRRALALALSAAAAALLGELGVRRFHPGGTLATHRVQYSRSFHHANLPSATLYHGVGEDGRALLVHTNADGLRTSYTRASFGAHALRLAVLGDSFAFGWKVADEQAFPARLERVLRERLARDDVAVLNAGVVSYAPFLERLQLDELVADYAPTHVVLLFDASDIGDDHEYARMAVTDEHGTWFPRTPLSEALRPEPSVLDRWALWQRVQPPLLKAWALVRHPYAIGSSLSNPLLVHGIAFDGVVERDRYFIYRHPLERTRPWFERTLANIDAAAARARSLGAAFVLVVAPRYHHWNRDECPRNWEAYAYRVDEPFQDELFRFFEEARARVDYPILDLLPAFRACGEFPLVFADDPHWNARGHELVASWVGELLLERGIVP